MITLSIDEKDQRVLRASASYLLVLAGDIGAEISGTDKPVVINSGSGFNAEEIAEAETLGQPHFTGHAMLDTPVAPTLPSAAEAFGDAGKSVPSIAAVEASSIAPVATTEAISMPLPPGAPVPPAPSLDSSAAIVAPPTAPPAAAVEVDARGLPWDSRIHSGGKTKLKNGNWVNKRGVDESVVKTIEGQLAAVMAIPASSSPAPVAAAPVPPQIPTPPAPQTAAPIATTASPSDAPALPPFAAFMQKVLRLTTVEKRLTQEQLTAILKSKGIEALPTLAQRVDLIPEIDALIDATILMA